MNCLTITLNAAIDTTYWLDHFEHGEANRVARKMMLPGGKGNNVARVLCSLGHTVVASGFIGGATGTFIEQSLQSVPGLSSAFLRVPGESRLCLTLIEQATGSISELLEPGLEISAADAERFLSAVRRVAAGVDVVICSGSLPRGLPQDYYARILGLLRQSSARLVLDTSGEPLRLGLAGRPDLLKPNRRELAELMRREATLDDMLRFAQTELLGALLAGDARILLSLGEQGAALVTAAQVLIAHPPPVAVVNTVGAGDALLAGFVHGQSLHWDDRRSLQWAVAAGSAATLQETAGAVWRADIEALLERVQVRTWWMD